VTITPKIADPSRVGYAKLVSARDLIRLRSEETALPEVGLMMFDLAQGDTVAVSLKQPATCTTASKSLN
jgi:hypothetical protein